MIGPIKQLYEKDGAEFKPIQACDCEGGGNLPDTISAIATAYDAEIATAEASVDSETGEFKFKFGLPKGKDGRDGKDGITPDAPVAHRTVMAFKTYVPTDENPKPEKPVGGYWDVENDIITYPEGWEQTDNIEKPVWMSTGEFSSASPDNPTWSEPIMISGEDGVNGTDGVATEFIYKLTKTTLDIPEKPESVNETEHIPDGWTDSPTGISEEMQVEWVCTRKKDDNGDWSSWEGPVIWSKWGVNGMDGDGIEYIYRRNKGEILDNPTPDDTSTDQYQEKGEYEDIEYVPEDWYDNPQGVSEEFTHEWVCVRKSKNGVWGAFSNPALWAKWGEQGWNGISIRTMYAKTTGSDDVPVFVQDNINPGSIWGLVIPNYGSPEAVWSIQAYVTYDNELATVTDSEGNEIYGWQGPVLITGVAGIDGVPVNYKTYVYKLSDTKPNKPTNDDPQNPGDGWTDYPNTTGQWWQCIGNVNGVTGLVTEWSEVLPVNGQDGTAQDGKRVEFRFAVNDSNIIPPSINVTLRQPTGWTTEPPAKSESQFMWMTVATINPNDTLATNWSNPVCISGEQGPQGETGPAGEVGPAGPNGVSGVPGVSFDVRYCLGTAETYVGSSSPTGDNPTGWQQNIPSVTKDNPYIWCIQGKRTYESAEDTTGTIAWSRPFRLSGINALPETASTAGQIVYPAGIYAPNKTYTCDTRKAPYVLDTTDGNYYVMNFIGDWLGTEQDGHTPSQSYAENGGEYWMLMEGFDAIYANIGVFGNALVGSAVFNGNYIFSQQGLNSNGASSSDFHLFCDNVPDDPYNIANSFKPNWCVNLVTGEQWASAGGIYLGNDSKDSFIKLISENSTTTVSAGSIGLTTTENGQTAGFKVTDEFIKFDAVVPDEETGGTKIVTSLDIKDDGSGSLANGKISWDKEGNLDFPALNAKCTKVYPEAISASDFNYNYIYALGGKWAGTINDSVFEFYELMPDGTKPQTAGVTISNIAGKVYFVRNSSGYALTAGGIRIPNEKSAIIICFGDSGTTGFIADEVTGGTTSSSNVEFVSSLPSSPDSNKLYVLV